MEQDDDKLFDRGPWQDMLGRRDDEPPALTDARIRAAARRALPPRSQRWWLPASLAASLLLAVLVVQWQFGEPRTPSVLTESDVAAPTGKERADAPAVLYIETESKSTPPPMIEMPAMDLPAPARAPEPLADEAAEADSVSVTSERRQEAQDSTAASAPPAELASPPEVQSRRESSRLGNLQKSTDTPRTPEDWYAEIEKLRADGRNEEADRELEELEAAHPGWLDEHHPQDR